MRSDDWLGAMVRCHLQMLHGQMVMRCLSKAWDAMELFFGLDNAPLWFFPVMISPDTNTHFTLATCVWTGSEAALGDWFVLTSGSTLTDEEFIAYKYRCLLKTLCFQEMCLKVCLQSKTGVCLCVYALWFCYAYLGMCMNRLVYLCIHWVTKCVDERKGRNVLHCVLVVLWVFLTVYIQQWSLSMRLHPLPVYSITMLSVIYNLTLRSISNNWIRVFFWPNPT